MKVILSFLKEINNHVTLKNLNDECDYVMINVATKQSAVSMGSAINSKLVEII